MTACYTARHSSIQPSARFKVRGSAVTLSQWLGELETRHTKEIDLGLDRVLAVFERMQISSFLPYVITVAGTNGKGTTLQAISNGLSQAGLRVACYTSPHFHVFNERIVVNGRQVSDDVLVSAFEFVEHARAEISLSYFEFTTLAALYIFSESYAASNLDVAVLEVGLGGRLDAVNVVTPNIAIVTSIGLDHQDWLGDTVEQIAREKAGVFRKGSRNFVGESFPVTVIEELSRKGIVPQIYNDCFGRSVEGSTGPYLFNYKGGISRLDCVQDNDLPRNNLCLAMQACLVCLAERSIDIDNLVGLQGIANAVAKTSVPGRLEIVSKSPVTIFDVAHNGAAASMLAAYIDDRFCGSAPLLVFSCLKDKDIGDIVGAIGNRASHWYIAALDQVRAMSLSELESPINKAGYSVSSFNSIEDAYAAARVEALEQGRALIVFGSFYVLEALRDKVVEG